MSKISSNELAKRWGVSQRQVQTYCKEGRIKGARRLGQIWLIPNDVVKPENPRVNKKTNKVYWPFFFLLDRKLMQLNTTEEMMANTTDVLKKKQLTGEMAYMQGDFKTVATCLEDLTDDSPSYLCALAFSTAAKVAMGDSQSFWENWLKLKTLHERFINHPENRHMIELVQGLLAISAYAPQHCPEWITNGVINSMPHSLRQMALYLRAKCLLALGRTTELISTAETMLSLSSTQNTIHDVYVYIILAHGYVYQDQKDRAYDTLLRAINLCIPKGFITPLVESISSLLGLTERCLRNTYPYLTSPIISLHRQLSHSWLEVHNMLTHEKISSCLTRREYQTALAVVGGLTNQECANRLGLSVSTVKGYLATIYQKLNISSRKELKSFIISS